MFCRFFFTLSCRLPFNNVDVFQRHWLLFAFISIFSIEGECVVKGIYSNGMLLAVLKRM